MSIPKDNTFSVVNARRMVSPVGVFANIELKMRNLSNSIKNITLGSGSTAVTLPTSNAGASIGDVLTLAPDVQTATWQPTAITGIQTSDPPVQNLTIPIFDGTDGTTVKKTTVAIIGTQLGTADSFVAFDPDLALESITGNVVLSSAAVVESKVPVVIPDGSTANPSLRFAGNPDVGLSNNAGAIALSTAGIERLRINNIAVNVLNSDLDLNNRSIFDVAPSSTTGSFYQTFTSVGNLWSGPWAAPQSGEYTLVRVGRLVTATILIVNVVANTSLVATSSIPIPAVFRPANLTTVICRATDNGVVLTGTCFSQTSGVFIIGRGVNGQNFSGAGLTGWPTLSWSWIAA